MHGSQHFFFPATGNHSDFGWLGAFDGGAHELNDDDDDEFWHRVTVSRFFDS